MTSSTTTPTAAAAPPRLPLGALLALATAGFITIMTEALPAGILPAMSADLAVSESAAGQTVTVYAIGSALAAVPLTALTVRWPRRRLLLAAIAGFAVANTITAVTDVYLVTLLARFLAGVVAGLLWALLAGYARRMVSPAQRGAAMAIVMAGTPVALSIGVPAGTFLAQQTGWRLAFGAMTIATLALIVWVLLTVPAFPGQTQAERLPLRHTLGLPGVAPVLAVTLALVLGHNILYTYIAPFLENIGMGARVDLVLLVFGIASLVGIVVTGALIDRHPRTLMLVSCALFAASSLVLGVASGWPTLVYASVAAWGLAFGGAASLLQTASAEAAGEVGDVAQSLVVTCWNLGIAGGGIAGGSILAAASPSALPWSVTALLVVATTVTLLARRHAFPARTGSNTAERRSTRSAAQDSP